MAPTEIYLSPESTPRRRLSMIDLTIGSQVTKHDLRQHMEKTLEFLAQRGNIIQSGIISMNIFILFLQITVQALKLYLLIYFILKVKFVIGNHSGLQKLILFTFTLFSGLNRSWLLIEGSGTLKKLLIWGIVDRRTIHNKQGWGIFHVLCIYKRVCQH